jgi:dephospho-CoA kinase
MFILGITGLYCSGKSVAGKFFKEHGFVEIDVDKLGHEALERKKSQIIKTFGEHIVSENDEINRKKLGRIVFENDNELSRLENIVHPAMIKMVKQRIKKESKKGTEYLIINAAILFKMKLDKLCHAVLAIVSPDKIIVERGKKRDNLSEKEILRRVKKQKIFNEKFKNADYFIVNNDDYQDFINKLENVLHHVKERNNG